MKIIPHNLNLLNSLPALKLLPLAASVMLLQLPAHAQNPAVGVQVQLGSTAHWPDAGPGSIGNQNQGIFTTGLITGLTSVSASQNISRGGTDGNSTSGTSTMNSTVTATLGVLHASGTATATSTVPNGGGFPHADAEFGLYSPTRGQFFDTVTLNAPGYSMYALVPVTITVALDWTGSYSGGGDGTYYSAVGASANFGVAFAGGTGVQESVDSSDGVLSGSHFATLDIYMQNLVPTGVSADLAIFAETEVAGYEPNGGTTSSSASSDAADTAHFYLDSVPGATITGYDGHDYSSRASVPDSTSTAGLAFLGVVACLLGIKGQKRAVN